MGDFINLIPPTPALFSVKVSIFRPKFRPNAGKPVSFGFVLTPGFNCLADVPHLILGEEILEICKELNYIFMAGDLVVHLLKSSQVILKKIFVCIFLIYFTN